MAARWWTTWALKSWEGQQKMKVRWVKHSPWGSVTRPPSAALAAGVQGWCVRDARHRLMLPSSGCTKSRLQAVLFRKKNKTKHLFTTQGSRGSNYRQHKHLPCVWYRCQGWIWETSKTRSRPCSTSTGMAARSVMEKNTVNSEQEQVNARLLLLLSW